MVDYYEVLSNKHTQLHANETAAELRNKLIELESLWTDRAATQPEKATEMLALINQAKKVFADDASKYAYDKALYAALTAVEEPEEDPDAARRAELKKWCDLSLDYMKKRQFDMAKAAVEEALKYQVEGDMQLPAIAAFVYYTTGDYQLSLNYANRAILLGSENPSMYITKARILDIYSVNCHDKEPAKAASYVQQVRYCAQTASELAEKQNKPGLQAEADGIWAFNLYFRDPQDKALAEKRAANAIRIYPNESNAVKVMDKILQERAAKEKAEREERERSEAAKRAERERREAAEKAAKEKKWRAAHKRRTLIIVVCMLVIVIGAPILYMRHELSSIGSGISYSFDESTGELRISGKGRTRDFPTTIIGDHGLMYAPWGYCSSEGIRDFFAKPKFEGEDVRTVVVGEGITYIGTDLFYGINYATQFYFPSSLEALNDYVANGCTIYYNGTIEEWIGLNCLNADDYVFDTKNASTVQCSNGEIQYTKSSNYAHYYSVFYDGTMSEMQEFLDSLGAHEDGCEGDDVIICSDGRMTFTNLLRA